MEQVSSKWIWTPFYILLFIYIAYRFGWCKAITSLIIIVLCLVTTDQVSSTLLRNTVCRLRPSNPENPLSAFIHTVNNYHGGSYGFPSSHAANTAGLTFICIQELRRRWLSYLMLFWMLLVCYSRMYLGVHYPSDILFGIALGFSSATLLVYSHSYIAERVRTNVREYPDRGKKLNRLLHYIIVSKYQSVY